MLKYDDIFSKLVEFADTNDMVKAMVLFGSRARTQKPADKYSDYDIIFFVSDVNYFITTDDWIDAIAKHYISFVERTAVQDYERRVFFDNAMDMDFIFYNADDAEKITSDPIIRSWYAKGYKIIVDKINYEKTAERNKPFIQEAKIVTEKEYANKVNNFWFHTVWACKKLYRGEIWASKNCIDGYLKNLIREMSEYEAAAKNGKEFETWHDGRFFDEWTDKNTLSRLDSAYGKYDAGSLIEALKNTMNIFSDIAKNVGILMNFKYPSEAEQYARVQIKNIMKH